MLGGSLSASRMDGQPHWEDESRSGQGRALTRINVSFSLCDILTVQICHTPYSMPLRFCFCAGNVPAQLPLYSAVRRSLLRNSAS